MDDWEFVCIFINAHQISRSIASSFSFLVDIMQWSVLHADNEAQKAAANHVVASLLNKNADGKLYSAILKITFKRQPELSQEISSGLNSFWENYISGDKGQPLVMRRAAIQSWVWV